MIGLQKLYLKLIKKKGNEKSMIINEEDFFIREELEQVDEEKETQITGETTEVEEVEVTEEVVEEKEVQITEETPEIEKVEVEEEVPGVENIEVTEEIPEVEKIEGTEETPEVEEKEVQATEELVEEITEVEEQKEGEVIEVINVVKEVAVEETLKESNIEIIDLINKIKVDIYDTLENNKEDLNNKANEIIKQINDINTTFDRKIAYDKHKEKIIDNLHRELQEYKEDLYIKMLKPILMDIIEIKDSMEKIEHACKTTKKDEITVEKMLKLFNTFSLDLGDILEKYDVQIYKESGENYKAIRQKVAKYVSTEDEELDKKIAESLTYGYELNGKVISPEKVAIYKVNLD